MLTSFSGKSDGAWINGPGTAQISGPSDSRYEGEVLFFQVGSIGFPSSLRLGGRGLGRGFEEVVPVVAGGAEALDCGMQGDHGLGHGVTGWVGVEGAVDREAGYLSGVRGMRSRH